ncbi:hypothetical protein [Flavobacterium subsaxonicum]|uniref:hypothetical protein n=1 Tax=Flavobacterium subsaxonicum TaxID=426226 RepID=UPI0003F66960|nr:hypothetical protein [Flavobacterium subsaxonicum]
MKKFVMAALLLASVAGFAQDKKELKEGHKPKTEITPDEQAKNLTKELGLNDKQQAKVKAFYTEEQKKRESNKPEGGKKGEKPDATAMEAKMKEEQAATDKKMKGILTDEQYTKWKSNQKNQGPKKPVDKKADTKRS